MVPCGGAGVGGLRVSARLARVAVHRNLLVHQLDGHLALGALCAEVMALRTPDAGVVLGELIRAPKAVHHSTFLVLGAHARLVFAPRPGHGQHKLSISQQLKSGGSLFGRKDVQGRMATERERASGPAGASYGSRPVTSCAHTAWGY